MKSAATTLLLSLFGALIGSSTAIPDFDGLHAHCGLDVEVAGDCASFLLSVKGYMQDDNFVDPGHGKYSFSSLELDRVEGSRLTKNEKYTDDVEFVVVKQITDDKCQVQAKSRSRSYSFYDYSVNYCNLVNLIRTYDPKFAVANVFSCNFPAKDINTCDTY